MLFTAYGHPRIIRLFKLGNAHQIHDGGCFWAEKWNCGGECESMSLGEVNIEASSLLFWSLGL